MPVAGLAGIGYFTRGGVQGSEQAGHPMPGVVMGLPFGDAWPHRQYRQGSWVSSLTGPPSSVSPVPCSWSNDEWTEARRYMGLEVLARVGTGTATGPAMATYGSA